jgi:hypothetical protein
MQTHRGTVAPAVSPSNTKIFSRKLDDWQISLGKRETKRTTAPGVGLVRCGVALDEYRQLSSAELNAIARDEERFWPLKHFFYR